ncbi:MAG: aminotransferase DegT [Gammaproteobacteria bacterium RIFCSPHIGHO2_12_FULL_35_23]|nr:MAG: aminotransferase DegT [Gammaproteobacteria bacterium RIFCSPHIGHO2_12_FULL_35_23]
MQVPFSALNKQHEAILPELMNSIENILRSGNFILGKVVEEFEEKFATFHQKKYAIGVASGTDALILALKALDIGKGDEVITTANTFITTVSSIVVVGAKPILIDIGNDDNIDVEKIEEKITKKTKAILPVHWTGRPCDMDKICSLAQQYNLTIIEDCAQAIAAKYKQQLVGTFGELGCFSLHPFKTLNACGDAGIIITDNVELADKIRALRQYGLSKQGYCEYWNNTSRLDSLQAAILNIKFKYFEDWTKRRVEIASYYSKHLKDITEIVLPAVADENYSSVFHTYIIKAQNREALREHLKSKGIETRIHYEVSIHKHPIAVKSLEYTEHDLNNINRIAKQVLSLPIYSELEEQHLDYIIEQIKSFYDSQRVNTQCESLIHI